MPILLVVNKPADWPLSIPGVDVVRARQYLTDPAFTGKTRTQVFNLSTSYRYQSIGYYVSLLAEARGHHPMPDVTTLRDLGSGTAPRVLPDDFSALVRRSLAPLQGPRFTLSIYFGRNLAKRYDRLAMQLFQAFRAPMLRAKFVKQEAWELRAIRPIAYNDVPEPHQDFVQEAATRFFNARPRRAPRRKVPGYDLAILAGDDDPHPPSNPLALRRFVQAAARLKIAADLITRDDLARIAEYDGLFIRQTTQVTNFTYRFARRAETEGLVVIDDSTSILRCTNKVYLAELLARHQIRAPRTVVVHRGNLEQAPDSVGLPCILKQPDSSYSEGVLKASTLDELIERGRDMLGASELLIAQEFMPTPFDWRIGILDGKPLYACKYYMAGRHWQIIERRGGSAPIREGKVEAFPIDEVPNPVIRLALRAANLIGRGLYGVDVKQIGAKPYVIEVNDNPSIDAGYEDKSLKLGLYDRIMEVFLERMEARRRGDATR